MEIENKNRTVAFREDNLKRIKDRAKVLGITINLAINIAVEEYLKKVKS